MSQFNGDKARFNRERKQNIQRRKRNKALFEAKQPKSGGPVIVATTGGGTFVITALRG